MMQVKVFVFQAFLVWALSASRERESIANQAVAEVLGDGMEGGG